MENLDPSDAAWWWVIGLQGGVGALVGGMLAAGVAWWAVVHTLKSERKHTQLTELRAAVIRLQQAALRTAATFKLNPPDTAAWVAWYDSLFNDLVEVDARAFRVSPALSGATTDLLHELNALFGGTSPPATDDAVEFSRRVSMTAYDWLLDPSAFRGIRPKSPEVTSPTPD